MSEYEVTLKPVEAVRVVSIREVMGKYGDIGKVFGELYGYVMQNRVAMSGPAIAVWYDPEYKEQDVDGEAAIPIQGSIPETDRAKVRELPPIGTAACTLHKGPLEKLPEAYNATFQWLSANGYRANGPLREVYLQMDPQGDPETYLTEVQFPLEMC